MLCTVSHLRDDGPRRISCAYFARCSLSAINLLACLSEKYNPRVAGGWGLSHREVEKHRSEVDFEWRVARLAASEIDVIAILQFGSHMIGP